jgi:hypothetical protein
MLSIRLAWQAVAIDLDDPHQIIRPVVGCVSKLAAAQPDEVVALGGDQMRVQIFGKPSAVTDECCHRAEAHCGYTAESYLH